MKFGRVALELLLVVALLGCGAAIYGMSKQVRSPFLPHYLFSHDVGSGTLQVQGTWALIDDEIANPIQSTTMNCSRSSKSCFEATAEIAGDLLLPIAVNTLAIERWDQDFIVVRGPKLSCVEEFYTLDLRSETVTGLASRPAGCYVAGEWPRRMRMVDGYDASWVLRGRTPLRKLFQNQKQ
jgi:hypothetical protein